MATSVIVSVSAATVPIGSGLNGINGLTNGTVTATTTAIQSSGGKYGEQTYANGGVLQAVTTSSTLPTGGTTLTAGGLTYDMVADSGAFAADNMWAGTNDIPGLNGNPATEMTTFTIPMGIFGVTHVGAILNDEYGSTTADVGNGVGVTTVVTFNFGSAASGAGFLGALTFDLVNGTDIFSSYNCTGGANVAACQAANLALHPASLSTNAYGTNGAVVTPASNIASVTIANAWSGTYSADTNGPYNGTNGSLYLDALNFYVGSFAGDELYNMVIQDTATAGSQSRDELVALTVKNNISSTPEPSTIVLLAMGLLVAGFVGRRTRASQAL